MAQNGTGFFPSDFFPGNGNRLWVVLIDALGLVPGIAVMPHHEKRDPAETSKELQNQVPADLTVLGIDARSGGLGSPGKWKAIGSGKVIVYRGSDWQVYQSGQSLPGDV